MDTTMDIPIPSFAEYHNTEHVNTGKYTFSLFFIFYLLSFISTPALLDDDDDDN